MVKPKETPPRPVFDDAWNAFDEVNMPPELVGQKIGGHVEINYSIPISMGGFENACPVRMSYVLNYTGFPIQKDKRYASISGADGMWYLYRVADLMNYLEDHFGRPDKAVRGWPRKTDFFGFQGILVIKGRGWLNAKGHVTLWDGETCPDRCHLANDPENGPFTPNLAQIWNLG
jgi:hypothetical protein